MVQKEAFPFFIKEVDIQADIHSTETKSIWRYQGYQEQFDNFDVIFTGQKNGTTSVMMTELRWVSHFHMMENSGQCWLFIMGILACLFNLFVF